MLKPHYRLYLPLLPRLIARLRWRVAWNTLKYLLHIGRLRRRGGDILPFMPISVTVWTTGRCNKACRFCYYQSELNRGSVEELELTAARFEQILDLPEVRSCLRICLDGGEPLLNADLPAMIRLAKRRGHLVTINTNALLVKNRLAELRADPPDLLCISYYPENQQAIEEAIALAAPHMEVMVLYLLSRSRLDQLDNVMQCAAANKVRAVWLGLFNAVTINNFSQGPLAGAALPGWPGEMIDAAGSCGLDRSAPDPFLQEVPLRGDEESLLALVQDIRTRYEKEVAIITSGIGCGQGPRSAEDISCRLFWQSMFIDAKGRTSPCCQFPMAAFAEDVFATPSPWNSERMAFLRRSMREGLVARPCIGCSLLCDDYLGM